MWKTQKIKRLNDDKLSWFCCLKCEADEVRDSLTTKKRVACMCFMSCSSLTLNHRKILNFVHSLLSFSKKFLSNWQLKIFCQSNFGWEKMTANFIWNPSTMSSHHYHRHRKECQEEISSRKKSEKKAENRRRRDEDVRGMFTIIWTEEN